jgi:hypothetical protein
LRANGPMPSQPGASPQETIRKSHQGPSARSIMPHAGTSTAFLMGRAVGAEYRFESISWGDAPGWDDAGALPLKSHVGAMPGLGCCDALDRRDATGYALLSPPGDESPGYAHTAPCAWVKSPGYTPTADMPCSYSAWFAFGRRRQSRLICEGLPADRNRREAAARHGGRFS